MNDGPFFLDKKFLEENKETFFETTNGDNKVHNMTIRLPFNVWKALQIAKLEGKIKSSNHFIIKVLEKLLIQEHNST